MPPGRKGEDLEVKAHLFQPWWVVGRRGAEVGKTDWEIYDLTYPVWAELLGLG